MSAGLIKLRIHNAPLETVKAEIFGPLAIHESVSTDAMSVSHVATGKVVLPDVDYGTALAFCKRTKHLNWSEYRSIRPEIEEACRLAMNRVGRG